MGSHSEWEAIFCAHSSLLALFSGEGEWLHIGDVKVPISRPASAELVPRLYGESLKDV